MIDKFSPLTVLLTFGIGWIMYTTTFDFRRYRFSTIPYLYSPVNSYARQIELEKLGKVYKYKEHLTRSMYEENKG